MKADKAFYNTLRAEVNQGEVKHILCLFKMLILTQFVLSIDLISLNNCK